MIKLSGTSKQFCDGITRRDLLQIGGISLWGLGLAGLADSVSATESFTNSRGDVEIPNFGRAKRCVLVYLFGAAPQHETFDPKPDAPAEIQGELKAISTSVPGTAFGEGLPKLAKLADRMTTIRSMSHQYPLHGVAYALSALPVYTTDLEVKPNDAAQWPYFGSVADWYWSQQNSSTTINSATKDATAKDVLRHVGLPWVLNSQVDDLGLIAGPYGAFLGSQFDPVWTRFHGNGLRKAPKCRHEQPKVYDDPYASCSKDCGFTFHGAGTSDQSPNSLSDARFGLRRHLIEQYDQARSAMDRAAAVQRFSQQKSRALSLLTSTSLRDALDIGRESESTREQYGYTLFGQSCLAARRLLEAGSRFVSVFWDAYGTYFSGGWDTHQNHYPRLKEYLLPGFDVAFSAFLADLDQRGLLDDTLVVCTTEHGRTPQIDSKPAGAARHHWSRAYSTVLAGGGSRRGAVVGRTDRNGGEVIDVPITPKDIQATAFHLLGIPTNTLMYDRQRNPHPLAGDGAVRKELIG